MPTETLPFLMFEGCAAESAQTSAHLFEAVQAAPDTEGDVTIWTLSVGGLTSRAFDSPIGHDFGFTPALSLYAGLDTKDKVRRVFSELSADGEILIPLDRYPDSPCHGWVNDRFGVSWRIGVTGTA